MKPTQSNPLFVLLVGLYAIGQSQAAIIAEDHFLVNYPTNSAGGEYSGNGLAGQNPTLTGWNAAWNQTSGNDINGNPMGLVYPGFASSGGCGSGPSGPGDNTRSGRPLTTSYTDSTNATIYLSVLMKMDSNEPGPYRTMELHSGGYDDVAHRKLQLGQSASEFGTNGYGLQLFNNSAFRLDLGAMDTNVNLFVIKFVFSSVSNGDSITVWRNPASSSFGSTEPSGGQSLSGFNLQFDRTTLAHFGGARDIHLDEIRIGDTWGDVTPSGSASAPVLSYSFDDAALGGWTEFTPANTNPGPRKWAITPSAFPNASMSRHGSFAIGQIVSGGVQDDGHPTLVMRSPKFKLNGNGEMSAWLLGGHGFGADCTGKLVSDLPANAFDDPGNTTFPSFLGVALRNVDTGTYVIARKKDNPGGFWEKATFTDAELDALRTANPDHVYTLDLLDVRLGAWGWAAMDSVVIPGDLYIDPNPPTISYGFDDNTLQGWTTVGTDSDLFFEVVPPSVNSPHQTPQDGAGFIGLHIPAFDPGINDQDSPHDTLWLRSPMFKLDNSGQSLLFQLLGGGASSTLPSNNPLDIPAASTGSGFRGVALRNADTNQFVLSGTKAGSGNFWEEISFTSTQLSALDQNANYTLELIDCGHGGWGWVNLDSVSIPGTLVGSTAFASWAASKGLSGPAASFGADPDLDGVANSLEFVLGGEPNPANPNAGSTPVLPIPQAQGSNLVFTYSRSDAAAYLNPTVEFDDNLIAPWTTAVDPGTATIQVTNGSPSDTVTVTIPKNGAPKLFARLKVVEPAP